MSFLEILQKEFGDKNAPLSAKEESLVLKEECAKTPEGRALNRVIAAFNTSGVGTNPDLMYDYAYKCLDEGGNNEESYLAGLHALCFAVMYGLDSEKSSEVGAFMIEAQNNPLAKHVVEAWDTFMNTEAESEAAPVPEAASAPEPAPAAAKTYKPPPPPPKKSSLTLEQKKSIRGLLFVSPFIIGFAIFYFRSLVETIFFSFSHTHMPEEGTIAGFSREFAGLHYFIEAFTSHPTFNQLLFSSILDMSVDVLLIIFFSLFMALILNQKFKGRTFVRAIFFMPVILNSEAISNAITMARAMMMGGMSPVSADIAQAAGSGGGPNVMYYIYMFEELGLPIEMIDYVVNAVSRISLIITASGVQMIIFIAALQSIAPALYEVARIEGATPYETFWKVTFPMVSPLIITNVVYTVVDSFIRSPVLILSYNTIFAEHNYSLGSVFSLVSMLAVCLLLLITCAIISKRTYYHN
jgi:ABC-type sugar transport system permease subunit